MSGYYLLLNGEFAYNKSYSVGFDFGSIKRLDRYPMGVLSTLYICFSVKNYDSDFIKTYFDSLKWYKEIYMIAAEGARNHGLLNVPTEDFFATRHTLPTNLKEQKKIAAFMKLLERRIDAQRRLVEALKSYKRGLSNALFERVIEFCIGSDNKRTQFSLGDLGEFYNGLTGKQKTDFEHGSEPYIPYVNVYKNMVADTSACESVSVSEREHQNKVRYGDILFTQSSETLEEVGLSSVWLGDFEPFLNSFCFGIHFHENPRIFPLYVAHYFRSTDARLKIMHEGQGITRVNLSAERIKNISIPLPQMEVQRKIGILLQCLNDKISGKQEIISQMEHLKIGLLQQLFI